jgi:hypothetical protein
MQKITPIQDETAAEKAIELFCAGYEPLLYAADLGVEPEQVWDTLRQALIHCRDNHARPNAGRPQVESENPSTLRSRRWREKRAKAKR